MTFSPLSLRWRASSIQDQHRPRRRALRRQPASVNAGGSLRAPRRIAPPRPAAHRTAAHHAAAPRTASEAGLRTGLDFSCMPVSARWCALTQNDVTHNTAQRFSLHLRPKRRPRRPRSARSLPAAKRAACRSHHGRPGTAGSAHCRAGRPPGRAFCQQQQRRGEGVVADMLRDDSRTRSAILLAVAGFAVEMAASLSALT
jgi:hypothetical protein